MTTQNSESNNFSLINIAAPKFLENALSEPAKEIGHSLANIFNVIFSPINYPIEKMRIKQAANLKKYEEDIHIEINKIHEENLIEPKLSIVGPALEASKYYIEEEDLRKMFAMIIASSMDNTKLQYIHHAFIEIIKQLSPLDAKNIMILKDKKILPVVNFYATNVNENYDKIHLHKDVFLSNPECNNIYLLMSSITNLKRLGLVDTHFDIMLKDKSGYDVIEKNRTLLAETQGLIKGRPESRTSFEHGILEFSPFGKDFIKVCL